MSALARYFHAAGKNVLGYDKTETKLTTELQKEGISITFEDVVDEKISSLKKPLNLSILAFKGAVFLLFYFLKLSFF